MLFRSLLQACTCLRYTPATVTFIGVKSSSAFITSVFFTFIFMLNSQAAQCNRVTISCNSASLLAINTMSSAYRRFVTNHPPILKPPSKPSRAKRIRTSLMILKRYGDSRHPCLNAFQYVNQSLLPPAARTFDFCISCRDLIRETRWGANPILSCLSTASYAISCRKLSQNR